MEGLLYRPSSPAPPPTVQYVGSCEWKLTDKDFLELSSAQLIEIEQVVMAQSTGCARRKQCINVFITKPKSLTN